MNRNDVSRETLRQIIATDEIDGGPLGSLASETLELCGEDGTFVLVHPNGELVAVTSAEELSVAFAIFSGDPTMTVDRYREELVPGADLVALADW